MTHSASNRPQKNSWRENEGGGFRQLGRCALAAVAICTPVLGIGGWSIMHSRGLREEAGAAYRQAALAWERIAEGPAGSPLPLEAATRGRDLYVSACIACHGQDGQGITGLGKSLAQSDFVAMQDDAGLARFIETGRPDAKPMPMLPKGGRDDLTTQDLADIALFIRGLQDPRRMPALPAYAAAAPSEADKDAALEAAGGDAELAEFIASGKTLYSSSCIACHGPGGSGIKGNGKALAKNPFVAGQDDDALLAFIKKGRDPSDPANTTGVGMPAKGGNPALSDDDILDIIAYVRTLQSDASANAQK